jgi:hypothetical protein
MNFDTAMHLVAIRRDELLRDATRRPTRGLGRHVRRARHAGRTNHTGHAARTEGARS